MSPADGAAQLGLDHRILEARDLLEGWPGDSARDLSPALDRLEALVLDARDVARAPGDRIDPWLALTAAGAVTLAQMIDLDRAADDQTAGDVAAAGARLREVLVGLAEQTCRWLRPPD